MKKIIVCNILVRLLCWGNICYHCHIVIQKTDLSIHPLSDGLLNVSPVKIPAGN